MSGDKVRNLLKCFDHITNGEDINDIINALFIFLAHMDIEYASDKSTLEERANDLKDNFIEYRNQLYVNMINEKSEENTKTILRILESLKKEGRASISTEMIKAED